MITITVTIRDEGDGVAIKVVPTNDPANETKGEKFACRVLTDALASGMEQVSFDQDLPLRMVRAHTEEDLQAGIRASGLVKPVTAANDIEFKYLEDQIARLGPIERIFVRRHDLKRFDDLYRIFHRDLMFCQSRGVHHTMISIVLTKRQEEIIVNELKPLMRSMPETNLKKILEEEKYFLGFPYTVED